MKTKVIFILHKDSCNNFTKQESDADNNFIHTLKMPNDTNNLFIHNSEGNFKNFFTENTTKPALNIKINNRKLFIFIQHLERYITLPFTYNGKEVGSREKSGEFEDCYELEEGIFISRQTSASMLDSEDKDNILYKITNDGDEFLESLIEKKKKDNKLKRVLELAIGENKDVELIIRYGDINKCRDLSSGDNISKKRFIFVRHGDRAKDDKTFRFWEAILTNLGIAKSIEYGNSDYNNIKDNLSFDPEPIQFIKQVLKKLCFIQNEITTELKTEFGKGYKFTEKFYIDKIYDYEKVAHDIKKEDSNEGSNDEKHKKAVRKKLLPYSYFTKAVMDYSGINKWLFDGTERNFLILDDDIWKIHQSGKEVKEEYLHDALNKHVPIINKLSNDCWHLYKFTDARISHVNFIENIIGILKGYYLKLMILESETIIKGNDINKIVFIKPAKTVKKIIFINENNEKFIYELQDIYIDNLLRDKKLFLNKAFSSLDKAIKFEIIDAVISHTGHTLLMDDKEVQCSIFSQDIENKKLSDFHYILINWNLGRPYLRKGINVDRGIDLVRELKEFFNKTIKDNNIKPEILMLSHNDDVTTIQTALDAGASGYIRKDRIAELPLIVSRAGKPLTVKESKQLESLLSDNFLSLKQFPPYVVKYLMLDKWIPKINVVIINIETHYKMTSETKSIKQSAQFKNTLIIITVKRKVEKAIFFHEKGQILDSELKSASIGKLLEEKKLLDQYVITNIDESTKNKIILEVISRTGHVPPDYNRKRRERIKQIPKADLHVHFGTAIPIEICYDLAAISLYRWFEQYTYDKKVHEQFEDAAALISDIIFDTISSNQGQTSDDFRGNVIDAFKQNLKTDKISTVNDCIRILAETRFKSLNVDQIACIFIVALRKVYRTQGFDEKTTILARIKELNTICTIINDLEQSGNPKTLLSDYLLQDANKLIDSITLNRDDVINTINELFPVYLPYSPDLKFDPLSSLLSVSRKYESKAQGLPKYLASSDLVGASLLQFIDTLLLASYHIVRWAAEENVIHQELRAGTHGFVRELRNPELSAKITMLGLYAGIKAHNNNGEKHLSNSILLTAKRHKGNEDIKRTINTSIEFITKDESIKKQCNSSETFFPKVLGLDLAGIERGHLPEDLKEAFKDASKYCLLMTAHAGEDASVESMWQATFLLHATRIGHGLKLDKHENLKRLFRDRQICVELCPKSNQFTNGYSIYPKIDNEYVFGDYMQCDIPVTINTDNPILSHRSDGYSMGYPLIDEYIALANMSGNINTLLIIQLIYNSFRYAFLNPADKKKVIAYADKKIFDFIYDKFFKKA